MRKERKVRRNIQGGIFEKPISEELQVLLLKHKMRIPELAMKVSNLRDRIPDELVKEDDIFSIPKICQESGIDDLKKEYEAVYKEYKEVLKNFKEIVKREDEVKAAECFYVSLDTRTLELIIISFDLEQFDDTRFLLNFCIARNDHDYSEKLRVIGVFMTSLQAESRRLELNMDLRIDYKKELESAGTDRKNDKS